MYAERLVRGLNPESRSGLDLAMFEMPEGREKFVADHDLMMTILEHRQHILELFEGFANTDKRLRVAGGN